MRYLDLNPLVANLISKQDSSYAHNVQAKLVLTLKASIVIGNKFLLIISIHYNIMRTMEMITNEKLS